MTIQRYHAGNLRPDQKKSWKADDGIFVLYVDHLAALAEKDKLIDLYLRTNKGHLNTILVLNKEIVNLKAGIEKQVMAERVRIIRGEFTQICSYCGEEMTKPSQWEKLQDHIQKCDKHPLVEARQKIWHMEAEINALRELSCVCCEEKDKEIAALKAKVGRLRDDYNDLTMEVSKKYPDETRHQTAKRYIRLAERGTIGGMGSGGSLKQEAKNESK